MGSGHLIHMVDIGLLRAHPLYSGDSAARASRALAERIAAAARYEPVVVRRHPAVAGAFEIVHGHQRVAALRGLGHQRVACLVWEMDDAEALAALAWANRHCGKEKAAGRLALLRGLHRLVHCDIERMARMVPESAETLRKVFAPVEKIVAGKPGHLG